MHVRRLQPDVQNDEFPRRHVSFHTLLRNTRALVNTSISYTCCLTSSSRTPSSVTSRTHSRELTRALSIANVATPTSAFYTKMTPSGANVGNRFASRTPTRRVPAAAITHLEQFPFSVDPRCRLMVTVWNGMVPFREFHRVLSCRRCHGQRCNSCVLRRTTIPSKRDDR